MKKLMPAKKLQLARESIVKLDEVQLRQVTGGSATHGDPCHWTQVVTPGG